MTPLLYDNDHIAFLIKITNKGDDLKHSMDFEIYEVTGWLCDDNNTPDDMDLYIEDYIKWDGCSHLWFGEKDLDGNSDGYLCLCGKTEVKRHADMIMKVYELAEKNHLL